MIGGMNDESVTTEQNDAALPNVSTTQASEPSLSSEENSVAGNEPTAEDTQVESLNLSETENATETAPEAADTASTPEEASAVLPTPGPQLTDEQDPDLDDDSSDEQEDEDEKLAERARMKARFRLGAAVSTTSLVEMAKQAREEAKAARRALDESTLPEGRFADRELSWLAFNERVLEQAEDQDVPILERAWFLAIFASNLDEFFMVRVAGLKRRIAMGVAVPTSSGLSPRLTLEGIMERAQELMARHAKVFNEDVQPKLADVGIDILHWEDLPESETVRLRKFFKKQIFPVLTPLAVDPAHPFPYISGLSLNLAVVVRNPSSGKNLFARIKMPELLPRFIAVDAEGRPYKPEDVPADVEGRTKYVPLEEVIGAHLDQLFPGMEIVEHYNFRVTRNEDLEVEEDDAENLLTALEEGAYAPPLRPGSAPRGREQDVQQRA